MSDQINIDDLVEVYAPPKDPVKASEAFLRTFTGGALLDFRDNVEATVLSYVNDTKYDDELKAARARDEQARKEWPKVSFAGDVASVFTPGGFVAKAGKAGKTGVSAIKRMFAAGTAGAASKLGSDNQDLTEDLGQTAIQAGKGFGTGVVFQGLGEGLGAGLKGLNPKNVEKFKQQKAIGATDALTSERRKLGQKQQAELGNWLVDQKVVTGGARPDLIQFRADNIRKASGKEIGEILDGIDSNVKLIKDRVGKWNISPMKKDLFYKQVDDAFQASSQRVAARIEKEILNPLKDNPMAATSVETQINQLQKHVDSWKNAKPSTLQQARETKSIWGRATDFKDKDIPEKYRVPVYNILKEEIADVVAKTEALEQGLQKGVGIQLLNVPGKAAPSNTGDALKRFLEANKQHSMAKSTLEMTAHSADRANSNRTLGLSEQLGLIQGAMTGNPVGAAVGVVAQKTIKKFGDSWAAVGAAKAQKLLEKPEINKFRELAKAATEGIGPFLFTHQTLLETSAEYRKEMNISKEQAAEQRQEVDDIIKQYGTPSTL